MTVCTPAALADLLVRQPFLVGRHAVRGRVLAGARRGSLAPVIGNVEAASRTELAARRSAVLVFGSLRTTTANRRCWPCSRYSHPYSQAGRRRWARADARRRGERASRSDRRSTGVLIFARQGPATDSGWPSRRAPGVQLACHWARTTESAEPTRDCRDQAAKPVPCRSSTVSELTVRVPEKTRRTARPGRGVHGTRPGCPGPPGGRRRWDEECLSAVPAHLNLKQLAADVSRCRERRGWRGFVSVEEDRNLAFEDPRLAASIDQAYPHPVRKVVLDQLDGLDLQQ